jgi:hypothetical protein
MRSTRVPWRLEKLADGLQTREGRKFVINTPTHRIRLVTAKGASRCGEKVRGNTQTEFDRLPNFATGMRGGASSRNKNGDEDD